MPTFEELIETLEDETASSYSRRSAISALVRLRDERAVQPLITALQDQDPYMRREAAKALGDMGFPAAVEPLVEALKDSEDNVRRNAITALGAVGDDRAIEPLKQMLQDQSFLTRSEAERSLRKIEARLEESAPAEESQAQPDPETESAPADVPDKQVVTPEELPTVVPVEEAAPLEISEPEDSPVEPAEEVEEPTEQPVEEKKKEDELPKGRKLTDEAESFILDRVAVGTGNAIMIYFEGEQSLHTFDPGGVMRGKVLVRIAKPMKSRGIYLSVEGKEKVRWTEGSGNNSRTYRDEHVIIDETTLLSGGQEEIQIGNYEYPFECRLPEDSPPPYHSKVCTCEYSISARIDVPMRRDVKDERSFCVSRPLIDRRSQTEAIPPSVEHSSQNITLSLSLKGTVYHVGSQIEGTISFQNHGKRKIRGIDVELLHQEHARCRGKARLFSSRDRTKETSRKANAIRTQISEDAIEEFQTDFSLRVPSSAEETGSWNLFHLDAVVKASLDVPWSKDVNCSHRIIIVPEISP